MYVKKNSWAKWTAIDGNGIRYEYEKKPRLTIRMWMFDEKEKEKADIVSTENDTSDWQNSLIEIDAQDKPYVHEFVNDWAKAFFVDKDGKGYEYTHTRMCANTSLWAYSPECNGKGRKCDPVIHNYKGDWKESLQIRKEDNETMDKDNNNDWDGEGMPPIGTICKYFPVREYGNEGLENWKEGDDIEVKAYAEVCGELLPIMFNTRQEEASTIVLEAIKPIKTEKQKIIEDVVRILRRHNQHVTTDCLIASATDLYNKGLLKENKEEYIIKVYPSRFLRDLINRRYIMKEKYYMMLLQKDSVLLNTFIDKSPARWAIENKEKRMVIIDFWEIEKEEYILLSQ